jgi:uncharacterized membrane protein YkoI
MSKNKIWAAAGFAATLITAAIITFSVGNEKIISKSEIIQQVASQYGGKVDSLELANRDRTKVYNIDLTNKQGSYRMIMNAQSGEVMNLSQVKAAPPSPYKVSEKQAESIASEELDGTVQSVEKGMDNEIPVYFVNVQTNKGMIHLKIDGVNGRLISQEPEQANEENPLQKTVINEEEAKKIALNHVKGRVSDIELEEDDDQYEFHVTISSGTDTQNVYINAYTGEITSINWEDDEDDDD